MKNYENYYTQKPMENKRTRTKLFHRFNEGLKQIYLKPLKVFPLLLLMIAFFIIWNSVRSVVSDMSVPSIIPQSLITYAVTTLLILLFIMAFTCIVMLLGTPREARRIDSYADLTLVDCFQDYYKRPFLISRTPIMDSGAEILVFWSYWLSKKKWLEREDELCDMMNVHLVEPISYGGKNGNNRRIIVLVVGKGAQPPHRGEMDDDEL